MYPAEGTALTTAGLPNTTKPHIDACALPPPALNVTLMETFEPAGDAPNTISNVLDDMMEQEDAVTPLMTAAQSPPCAGVMKLEPTTVTELD